MIRSGVSSTVEEPVPQQEQEDARLQALQRYRILDSLPERAYDDIALLASKLCGTPMAVVTFIDEDRQWFKASVGLTDHETPRAIAFCDHAIREPDELLVVRDASQDPRFSHHPQVTAEHGIRFYAGAPLVTPDGFALGTVCVVDDRPRELEQAQLEALRALAGLVVQLLEFRQSNLELQRMLAERELVNRDMLQYQRQLEVQNTELAVEASHDALTGLLNRTGMEKATAGGASGSWVSSGPFSVAVLDIDHFKRINDRLGHAAGDMVIRIIGEEIRRAVRGGDIAVRYGGEEFLVMMPATPTAGAYTVVQRIRQEIALRTDLPGPVTVSAGLATGLAGRDDPQTVFKWADQALYLAKRRGRDQVEVAED